MKQGDTVRYYLECKPSGWHVGTLTAIEGKTVLVRPPNSQRSVRVPLEDCEKVEGK